MRNFFLILFLTFLAILDGLWEVTARLFAPHYRLKGSGNRLPRRVRMQMNDAHYKSLNKRVRAHERHKLPMGIFRRVFSAGEMPSPCGG